MSILKTHDIYKMCKKCGGTGEAQEVVVFDDEGNKTYHTPDICDNCKGAGERYWGNLTELTNIFDSYAILEAIDPTEYNALTDTKKEGVTLLLSCGKVDLNEGKAGRVRLLNWFGAGSTTVTNLTALIT